MSIYLVKLPSVEIKESRALKPNSLFGGVKEALILSNIVENEKTYTGKVKIMDNVRVSFS